MDSRPTFHIPETLALTTESLGTQSRYCNFGLIATHPQAQPEWGSNPCPLDHGRTFRTAITLRHFSPHWATKQTATSS